MIQSYDDEATALVGFFSSIPTLTFSDTGCKQQVGHEDDRKRYPLLDFGRIGSPAWTRFILSHFCIGPILDSLAHWHACMHLFGLFLIILLSIPLHARMDARTHACTSFRFQTQISSFSSGLSCSLAHTHFTWKFTGTHVYFANTFLLAPFVSCSLQVFGIYIRHCMQQ